MKAWPFVAVLVLAYFYKVGWATIVARNNAVAQAAPAPAAPVELASPRERWAVDLASRLGNTAPTAETIAFIVAWQEAENTAAQFNPIATSQDMPGATVFNGDGVKNYATYQDGIEATAITLGYSHSGYADIMAGIQTNDVQRALNGLYASPWGTDPRNVETLYQGALAALQATPAATGEAETRAALVAYALALQGMPYISGGRSASGGDCSGTMQHIYKTIVGVDIGATTFSQLPQLRSIDLSEAQPGDLWYGQYPDDQHTGMLADVDSDGRWDLINNGGLRGDLHVDYDFLSQPYFAEHTIGFRRAL